MEPSGEKASWVWLRGVAWSSPERIPEQLRQAQFHCGKPPPAAEPRILMRMVECHAGNGVAPMRRSHVVTLALNVPADAYARVLRGRCCARSG